MGEVKERKKRVVDVYRTCYVCGKTVYTGMFDMREWVYKYNKEFCCSYSCYNKANGYRRNFK